MILQYTHEWIAAPSPHTGRVKTQTRKLAAALDYAVIGGVKRYVSPLDPAVQLAQNWPVQVVCDPQGHTRYRSGNPYAVQPGRGLKAIARIQIDRIVLQRAGDITDSDAILEGFSSARYFAAEWEKIHGLKMSNAYVWVLSFTALPVQVALL